VSFKIYLCGMCVLSIDHRIFRTFPRFYITYHSYKSIQRCKIYL